MKNKLLVLSALIISVGLCLNAGAEELLKIIKPDFSKRSVKHNAYGQATKIISTKDKLTLLEFDYQGSYYKGATVTFYFENTSGTREHQFTAKLMEKKIGPLGDQPNPEGLLKKTSFKVGTMKKYALRVPIAFGNSMSTQHDASTRRLALREFTIQWIEDKSVLNEFSFEVPAFDAKIEELQFREFQ